MMTFNQLSDMASNKGFRRNTGARAIYEDNGSISKVYDFEHRKKLDMFSIFVDEWGAVKYAEYTKVDFDREAGRFKQNVVRLDNDGLVRKYLGSL